MLLKKTECQCLTADVMQTWFQQVFFNQIIISPGAKL